MPDERKRKLVGLLTKRNIPVIENDVYNEIHFDRVHPSTLKSFDSKGLVLHCGSFSKTLTAAYRIGWALPGRFRDGVEIPKFLNTLTLPSIPQMAIAEFLARDAYEHHLRKVRKMYAQLANLMKATVAHFFPEGTRMSNPAGDYVLWIELPLKVDAMRLYTLALDQGITIGPGYMLSVSETTYRNFIRLNYSSPWSSEIEQGVITIGTLSQCAPASDPSRGLRIVVMRRADLPRPGRGLPHSIMNDPA